ncbi:MAG: fabG1 [Clostridiaceae bacterium]|jgi:3-oxoacyl-[acyl-carrier protein] reductase|nr:fabG1 [Clostridiaceae bacterium]
MSEKTVLITGGSKGLGRAAVEYFVESGYNVAFTYLNSEDRAKELHDEYGDSVLPIQADASNYDRAFEVVEEVMKMYGKIDTIINNVALAKDKPIWEIDKSKWDFTINNALNPCFNYTRAVVNEFIKNRSGKIINIGSINGMRGREGSVGYCTAKAGIIGFTKTIAKELGEFNITANVIAPGYIDTDGQANTSQLIKNLVLDECAIRRLTKPIEIVYLIEFLASYKGDNITGQVYQVDCGQYI